MKSPKKTKRWLLLTLIITLLISACSSTIETPEGNHQAPIDDFVSLDDQLLEISESVPDFAGMYYNDDGELTVGLVSGLSTASLESVKPQLESAIEHIFGAEVFNKQLSVAQLEALQTASSDGLSTQAITAPERTDMQLVNTSYSFKDLYDWYYNGLETFIWQVEGVNSLDLDEMRNRIVVKVEDEKSLKEAEALIQKNAKFPQEAVMVEIEEAAQPLRL